MAESSTSAGPSGLSKKSRKQKRKTVKETDTPSKTPRLTSPESQEDDQPIASSSKANNVDPMAALENDAADQSDLMERLAQENGEEGTVVPTRADDFEQEAEREVEASKGLDGAVEEGKMKLVHQVRHQVNISYLTLVDI